ncbi:MAG: SPFH domain-containing protein [Candidatus Eisenbacteria bacterium]|uniref:SPFH domain-containing protein n=1 Tax=Eiseniibacteriota bacterium TaxID=2212470 RepID=A0A956RRG3_UNCEI|nr:SPFH domain-containing protein [Candidatus Eisenbacteria bacterium]
MVLLLFFGSLAFIIWNGTTIKDGLLVIPGIFGLLLAVFLTAGFCVVNPNQAAVLVLFGNYRGSIKQNGFWWTNPLLKRSKISLRARTLNSEKLKVNDARGNPIEIGAVVVWQVRETAQASFDVDDYGHFVSTQSETAVRKLASSYPYDGPDTGPGDGPEDIMSLRGATDEINHHLQEELGQRLSRAGVEVIEARLSHLAYAPEIAGAMLQRQQAEAVVAARYKIVEGAVGMVQDALGLLKEGSVVELDDERRAAMVSNLMVVLCGDHSTSPVVNVGTLYN